MGSQVHQGSAASERAEQPTVLLYKAHFRPQQAQVRPELPPPRASQQTVCEDAADQCLVSLPRQGNRLPRKSPDYTLKLLV